MFVADARIGIALTTAASALRGRNERLATIPSPYAYSPTHQVYRDEQGRDVIVVETAHKRYDVFQVPADVPRFVEQN